MSDVFISYSRQDKDFVRKLYNALKAHNREVWVDWDDIPPSAQFLQEIYAGIEGADAFVCILSPDFVHSAPCKIEVGHAVSCNKRLVPVVYRDITPIEADKVNLVLATLNWLYIQSDDDFQDTFYTLIDTLDTDLDYVHTHTQLLVRAREWESKKYDRNLTLRGKPLEEAEFWSVKGTNKKPGPTELQRLYITASRRNATTRQRFVLGAVSVALAITILLALFSFLQYQMAQTETQKALAALRIAQSQALAGEGNFYLTNGQFDLGLLLSARAYQIDNNYQSRDSLLNALEFGPRIATVLQSSSPALSGLTFSPDGQTLISSDVVTASIANHRLSSSSDGVSPDYGWTRTDSLIGHVSSSTSSPYSGITFWDMATKQPHNLLFAPLDLSSGIDSLVLSPDGKIFATTGAGGVWLWEAKTGALLATLNDASSISTSANIAFSPDGKLLVSVGCSEIEVSGGYFCHDEPILVWDIAKREVINSLNTSQNGNLTISPDGKLLATWGCDSLYIYSDKEGCSTGHILLWDMLKSAPRGSVDSFLSASCATVNDVQFSPDGKLLVANCSDGSIKMWNLASNTPGEPASSPMMASCDTATNVQFSPDGKLLAANCSDGSVKLWDVASRKLRSSLTPTGFLGKVGSLSGIAFNASGSILASSAGNVMLLWDTATGQSIGESIDPYGEVMHIAWSSRGQMATSDSSNAIILWNTGDVNPLDIIHPGHLPTGLLHDTVAAAFSPDGKFLALGERDRKIILWDWVKMAEAGTLSVSAGTPNPVDISSGYLNVTNLTFNSDGKRLAASTYDGHMSIWDVTTKNVVANLVESYALSPQVTLSPDGRMLASGKRGDIDIWDIATQTVVKHLVIDPLGYGAVTHLAFSMDGRILGSNYTDNSGAQSVFLWDVITGAKAGAFITSNPADPFSDMSFSPDGHTIALISKNGNLSLWNISTGQSIGQFSVNDGAFPYNAVAFSPDGKMIAVSRSDGISLWNVVTHEQLAHTFINASETIFSPNGQSIAFFSSSGLVFWDINPASWQLRVCNIVNRNFTADEWRRFANGEPYQKVCPNLPVHESEIKEMFFQALSAAGRGDAETASASYKQATQWAIETDNPILNYYICWYGSIDQFAKEVLPACERAVTLEPTNGIYQDSRGLALALTGDRRAIADFQAFVIWATKNNMYSDKPYLAERKAWVNALRAGHNPFDAKTLQVLRNE